MYRSALHTSLEYENWVGKESDADRRGTKIDSGGGNFRAKRIIPVKRTEQRIAPDQAELPFVLAGTMERIGDSPRILQGA